MEATTRRNLNKLAVSENDIYVDSLVRTIRELADKLKSKAPHLQFYSDSEQNKRTFELYKAYPEVQKKRILDDVIKYNSVIDSMSTADAEISNKSALWVALKLFGIPSSLDELFQYIEESDVIEVYRYDGIQVFRNLNFHDICSYELPELFIHPWDTLFYRPSNITSQLEGVSIKVFTGQHRGILNLESIVGEHSMCEIFSPKRHKLKMRFKHLYPLRNKANQVEYVVSISKVQIEEQYFDFRNIIAPPNGDLSI